MKSQLNKLFFGIIALSAISASPLRAELDPPVGSFFDTQEFVGYDDNNYPTYYLPDFQYYTYDPDDDAYVYKYDFGWLYYFGANDPTGTDEAYFYDYTEDDVFYTSPELYPYIYSFNLDTYLYYFESSDPRTFYSFDTDEYIAY